jgi:hypothetical protein
MAEELESWQSMTTWLLALQNQKGVGCSPENVTVGPAGGQFDMVCSSEESGTEVSSVLEGSSPASGALEPSRRLSNGPCKGAEGGSLAGKSAWRSLRTEATSRLPEEEQVEDSSSASESSIAAARSGGAIGWGSEKGRGDEGVGSA